MTELAPVPDGLTLLAIALMAGCAYRSSPEGVEVWWSLAAPEQGERLAFRYWPGRWAATPIEWHEPPVGVG